MDSAGKEAIEKVKKDVRSVLITESGGMLLEDFMKIFRQLTNSTIPYRRLGYQSAEELLLDATDVCRCQRLSTGQLHLRPVCDRSTSHVLKMVERSRKHKSSGGCRAAAACRQRGQRVPWLPGIQPPSESEPEPVRRAGSVPVEVRESVLKLLASHPQGIHLDELNQKHKDMFGHAITYIGLGFYSMKGMLESIPHLARLKATPTGDKAFPIPAPEYGLGCGRETGVGAAKEPPPAAAFLSYEDSVRGLKERIMKVLSAQKTSVKVSDILNIYLREYGRSLAYEDYGFTSLLGALASLGPPFRLEKRADDWHVSVRRGGGRGDTATPGSAANASPGPDELAPEGGGPEEPDRPPPLAGLPRRFTLQPLGWLERDGRQVTTETGYPLLEVVITHVRSPGEFSFCLSGSACELDEMELALEAVYGGAAGRRMQPPDWQLTVGRPLAAYSPNGWRRALLLGRVAEQVKVYLVDTGATLLLHLHSVRTLHDQFMDMPALAHEGTLARVAPLHGSWSAAARRLFNRLVGDHSPLMATVLLQSQFGSTLLLCDTSGQADVHVGDELVSARHATVSQEDGPPAPLTTPHSRLLTDLERLLNPTADTETSVTQQDRVPPEGAEPLSPAASGSQPETDRSRNTNSQLDNQVTALKVQCYDTQKLCQASTAGPRRAALQAKLRRLETQLELLLTHQ